MLGITLLMLSHVSVPAVVHDRVDVIELNHYLDGKGDIVFDQYVFWIWNPEEERHDAVDWRFCKPCGWRDWPPELYQRLNKRLAAKGMKLPLKQWSGSPMQVIRNAHGFSLTWHDKESRGGHWRTVSAPCYVQSFTQYDVEVEARNDMPIERRRKLSRP